MTRRKQLLDRIRSVLVRTACRRALVLQGSDLACNTCCLSVQPDGTFCFAGVSDEAKEAEGLSAVKPAAKHRMGHLAEMLHVVRPGGRVHCYFPFMQAFHASPHDDCRRTIPGLLHLFETAIDCRAWVASGPTSGLVWTTEPGGAPAR